VIVDTGLPLHPLIIRPENFMDKVTQFLGFEDINFELNEFSNRFHVTSPERQWAFDVLHQATMEFLLESPMFSLELRGRHMIAYRGSRMAAGEFEQALGVIEGVLSRFPEYLLRELKGVT
jgi:hypothetical protein